MASKATETLKRDATYVNYQSKTVVHVRIFHVMGYGNGAVLD